jgi:hypothetical protein
MKITRVGLDIAKQVFRVHGVDEWGKARVGKQLARAMVVEFFAQLPPCLIGIEACSSALAQRPRARSRWPIGFISSWAASGNREALLRCNPTRTSYSCLSGRSINSN